MPTVHSLREARESCKERFMLFTKIYAKNKNSLICFFEGADDSEYYSARISMAVEQFEHIDSKGKENVINLFKYISKHKIYNIAKVAFFCRSGF